MIAPLSSICASCAGLDPLAGIGPPPPPPPPVRPVLLNSLPSVVTRPVTAALGMPVMSCAIWPDGSPPKLSVFSRMSLAASSVRPLTLFRTSPMAPVRSPMIPPPKWAPPPVVRPTIASIAWWPPSLSTWARDSTRSPGVAKIGMLSCVPLPGTTPPSAKWIFGRPGMSSQTFAMLSNTWLTIQSHGCEMSFSGRTRSCRWRRRRW